MGIGQAGPIAAVDEVGDKRGAGEAEKFVAAAVEFIGAAEEAGAGDVVGEVGVDRGDEQGKSEVNSSSIIVRLVWAPLSPNRKPSRSRATISSALRELPMICASFISLPHNFAGQLAGEYLDL